MLRLKMLLVSLGAVLALGAVTATMATAAEFQVEGKAVTSSTPIEGSSGISKLKTTIAGTEVVITCHKDKLSGNIETAGLSSGELSSEECEVGTSKEQFTSCEVPTIKFKFDDLLVVGSSNQIEDEFKPASGGVFAEIAIKNVSGKTCVEKGTYPVEGTQTCALPNGETSKVEHEIECKTTGSNLTFKGNLATYEGVEKTRLTSGKAYDDSVLYYVTYTPNVLTIPGVTERRNVTFTNVGLDSAEIVEDKLSGIGAGKYRIVTSCGAKLIDHNATCTATIERTAAGNQAAEYEAKIKWPLEFGSITFGVTLQE